MLGFIRFDLKVCPELTNALTDEVTGGVLELLSQLKRQCAKKTYLIGGVEKVFKNYFRNCIAKTALQNYYMQDCSVNFLKSIIIIIILQ